MQTDRSLNLKKGFWDQELAQFYITRRNLKGKLAAIEKDHNIRISSLSKLKKVKKYQKSNQWNSICADFGEVCTQQHLEKEDKIHFLEVRWVTHPLKMAQDLDLMGVRLTDKKICYAEAKTRNTSKQSEISQTLSGLTEQLKDNRIDKTFNSPLNIYQSLVWLKYILRDLIEKKEIPLDEENINRIISEKTYIRYGAIIRQDNSKKIDFSDSFKILDEECKEFRTCSLACKKMCDKRSPITFIDFAFENLEIELEGFIRILFD